MEPFTALTLRNLRCFADVTLRLDPRITLLIGENGAGKTTVAEALASLAYGDDEGLRSFPLRYGERRGRVALHGAEGEEPAAEWTVDDGSEERRRLPSERTLLAYGRYRRVHHREPPPPPGMPELLGPEWEKAKRARPFADLTTAARHRRTTTLMRPDADLAQDLGVYLVELDQRRSYDRRAELTWRSLEDSIRGLGQGLEGFAVVERRGRPRPVLVRRGVELDLADLSDGYQSVLVIVFDLVLRYLVLSPGLGNPLEGRALVVVDEVELHLHPRWQRRVVGQLARLFPRTQFVLTTHSPAVVQGAIDKGLAVTVLRERDGAVEPVRLAPEELRRLEGAEIGSLWTEERLFAVPSRYSPRFEAIEEQVRELRQRLEAGEAGAEDRQRLIAALEKLELLVAEDEERRSEGPLLSELSRSQMALLRQLEEMVRNGGRA